MALPDAGCDAGACMMALCLGTLNRFALGVMTPAGPSVEVSTCSTNLMGVDDMNYVYDP